MDWEEEEPHIDADDGEFLPYLPPEDRLWRHPAELGAERAALATVTTPWRRSLLVGCGAVVILGFLASGLFLGLRGNEPEQVRSPETEVVLGGQPLAWAEMAETAQSSVVTVIVSRSGGEVTTGAAFAFQRSGRDLMTTADLLAGAESVVVRRTDGTTTPAVVVGRDRRSGIGVISLSGDTAALDPLPLALIRRPPEPGDTALVVTPGLTGDAVEPVAVTAVDRCLDPAGDDNLKQGLIQLSGGFATAASGSPVLDGEGRAIGVAIDLDDEAGAYVVPIAYATAIAFDLLQRGVAIHSGLGIDVLPTRSAEVYALHERSAAAQAGLHPGDIITELDGVAIDSVCTLNVVIRGIRVGESVSLTYQRDGVESTTSVTMGERSPE